MSEAKIKFYSTNHILFQERMKSDWVKKNCAKTFIVKTDPHHVDILENKNQILCTFFCDVTDYQFDEDSKVLKIYYKGKESMDTEPELMLEMTSHSFEVLRDIMENMDERQIYVKYKGPLSYNPAQMNRTSLLSTESPDQNFRGFLNAACLALLINNIRVMSENAKMYSYQIQCFLYNPISYVQPQAIFLSLILLMYVLFAFAIQKLSLSDKIGSLPTAVLNFINTTMTLLTPIIFKQYFDLHFFHSIILIFFSCILWLKLISYAHVSRNIYFLIQRIQKFEIDEKSETNEGMPINNFITDSEASSDNLEMLRKHIKDPENILKIRDLFYFIAAPTLCFQLVYPRTQRIRKLWLAKRIVEFVFTVLFQTVIWFQYLTPLLEETYELEKDPKNNNMFFFLERMLQLSIPNIYFWVSGFFGMFQVFFNITAELLRYGDRQFYLDWWNCKDLEQYWRKWNLPVHTWCVRHFYNPMLKRGFNKAISNLLVFTLSAFLHEWVASGALNVVSYHAFLAMWIQAPVIFFQRKLNKFLKVENSQLGNVMFWLSCCFIGQPTALYIYYKIYRNKFG